MEYELLIRNGAVIDGSGAPRILADVAVLEGKIAAIIPAGSEAANARDEIDARTMVVAPGFIDLHSHSDWVAPLAEHGQILKPFVLQGVTTLIGGNCGFSIAPIRKSASRLLDESSQMLCARPLDWRWETVKDLRSQLDGAGLALNLAHLAGHGSIRLSVMGGSSADPNREELDAMRAMVERAMADGAVGLSTGLGYFPGMVAKQPELAALAEIAGAAGGILTSHLRAYSAKSAVYNDSDPHNILAIREMVRVARAARVPLEVSHLIFVGKRTWATVDAALAEVEHAREDGVEIGFDTFPYTGGNTTIRVLFPGWSQGHLMTHLSSAQSLERLRRETFGPLGRFIGKSAQLLWAVKPEFRNLEGKYFAEIAERLKMEPAEAYLTLARESGGRARVMLHEYSGDDRNEDALRTAMAHPLNAFEMDTILTSHGHDNPASYGTYPRILGYYVRELGVLSLENAIHKCTGMAAHRMRLGARGLIRNGYAADITIFNPQTVAGPADFTHADLAPIGIEHVIINGAPIVRDGKFVGNYRAGKFVTRAS